MLNIELLPQDILWTLFDSLPDYELPNFCSVSSSLQLQFRSNSYWSHRFVRKLGCQPLTENPRKEYQLYREDDLCRELAWKLKQAIETNSADLTYYLRLFRRMNHYSSYPGELVQLLEDLYPGYPDLANELGREDVCDHKTVLGRQGQVIINGKLSSVAICEATRVGNPVIMSLLETLEKEPEKISSDLHSFVFPRELEPSEELSLVNEIYLSALRGGQEAILTWIEKVGYPSPEHTQSIYQSVVGGQVKLFQKIVRTTSDLLWLPMAARYGHLNLVDWIIMEMKRLGIPRESLLRTALMAATENGYQEIVSRLLSEGTLLDEFELVPNNWWRIPRDLVKQLFSGGIQKREATWLLPRLAASDLRDQRHLTELTQWLLDLGGDPKVVLLPAVDNKQLGILRAIYQGSSGDIQDLAYRGYQKVIKQEPLRDWNWEENHLPGDFVTWLRE